MKTKESSKSAVSQDVAVTFYRVSTDKQSNERQFEDVRKYCKAYGYTISKEFEEIISGASKLTQRKELKAMLQYVQETKPKYVICSELSRLARSQDAVNIIKGWTEQGICFISLKEGIRTIDADGKSSAMTDLLLSIMTALNVFELQTIKYRVKSGLSKTVNTGTWSGGAVPYGYYLERKRLIVNSKESEWVKYMFEKYAEGWGTTKIAMHLNKLGISTKGGVQWNDTGIVKILNNSIYVGKRKWLTDIIEQPELRIIDDTTFSAVQKRLSEKSNTGLYNKQKVYNYLLSGKITCACGKRMVGKGDIDKYICKSNKYSAGCGVKPVSLSLTEEKIKTELYINYNSLLGDNKQIIDNTMSLEAELSELAEKIAKEKIHQNYLINSISRIGESKFNEKFDASKVYLQTLEAGAEEISIKLKATQKFRSMITPKGFKVTNPISTIPVIGTGEISIDKELLQSVIDKISVDNENIEVSLVNGNKFQFTRESPKRGRPFKKVV